MLLNQALTLQDPSKLVFEVDDTPEGIKKPSQDAGDPIKLEGELLFKKMIAPDGIRPKKEWCSIPLRTIKVPTVVGALYKQNLELRFTASEEISGEPIAVFTFLDFAFSGPTPSTVSWNLSSGRLFADRPLHHGVQVRLLGVEKVGDAEE